MTDQWLAMANITTFYRKNRLGGSVLKAAGPLDAPLSYNVHSISQCPVMSCSLICRLLIHYSHVHVLQGYLGLSDEP